jgi:hypothetical protein
MPKENYFVITLELSFLALSFFFLIEVTSISAIQINYKRWERAFRAPALARQGLEPRSCRLMPNEVKLGRGDC